MTRRLMTTMAAAIAITTNIGSAAPFDLLAHETLEFEVLEEAEEDLFEQAGGFADAHHRQVER